MIYELTNKLTRRKVTVTQKQLDILKGKNWLSRYETPKIISSESDQQFIPEEIQRLKTVVKPNSGTVAEPILQAIPDLPE